MRLRHALSRASRPARRRFKFWRATRRVFSLHSDLHWQSLSFYSLASMAMLQPRDLLVREIRELEAIKQHLMLEVVSLEQLQQGLVEQIESAMQTLYESLSSVAL
jgi:hypothetical protein